MHGLETVCLISICLLCFAGFALLFYFCFVVSVFDFVGSGVCLRLVWFAVAF